MKIEVKNVDEFFNSLGKFKCIALEIDEIISGSNLYKDRNLHVTDSVTLLGYGFKPYKNTCYDGKWPMISMSPQKNSLNLYVMIYENDKNIISDYVEVFGKSNVGVGCIRIKVLNDNRIAAIKEIIAIASKKV